MLNLDMLLFAIAAIGGITLLVMRINGKPRSLVLALGHGLFAAAGLAVLIYMAAAEQDKSNITTLPLIFFLVAALGGFFLFSYRLRKKDFPIPVGAIHGLVAVVGFLILLFKMI
jgi:lipid-A-disaccharide synthase-like uncharacterized protein